MEATRRSILRYLRRYDREWRNDQSPVWCYLHEFEGCTPPEEHPQMGVVLIRGRVRRAAAELVRAGVLQRRQGAWRVAVALTDEGRASTPYEPVPQFPTHPGHESEGA